MRINIIGTIMTTVLSKPIEEFLDSYCAEKGYRVEKKDIPGGIHYVVTNYTEKVTLDL